MREQPKGRCSNCKTEQNLYNRYCYKCRTPTIEVIKFRKPATKRKEGK